jgi:hypothetical protein
MSTTNNVELLIITIVLSLFFLGCIVVVIQVILLFKKIGRLTAKAESVIDSVESAAETIKHFSWARKSRSPLAKIISSFLDLNSRGRS